MSFIYEDKNLIAQLIKSAQVPDQQHIELAKKLIQNLQIEVAGGTVFTAEREDADLDQTDLVDLSSLFYFLMYNTIRANNKSLVIKAPGFDLNQLGEDAKLYVKYPSQGEPQYYVYRDGLTAYLNDLEKRSANNPLFMANSKKLLQKVNVELPAVAKPTTPGATPGAAPGAVGDKEQQAPGTPSTQDLHKLLGKFPLQEDRIDFTRIKNFLNAFQGITTQSADAVNKINQALNNLSKNFTTASSQGLNVDADDLANLLGKHPFAYVSALNILVGFIYGLLNDLKSINYDQMDETYQQQIDQQIGTDGSSIYAQNMFKLKRLLEQSQNWKRTT